MSSLHRASAGFVAVTLAAAVPLEVEAAPAVAAKEAQGPEAPPPAAGTDGGACRPTTEGAAETPTEAPPACDEGLLCHEGTCMTAERRDALYAEAAKRVAPARPFDPGPTSPSGSN